MAMARTALIACTLRLLVGVPMPLHAQSAGAEHILGMWYAASRKTEDGSTVPVDYGTQATFWIYQDGGQFFISSGFAWSSVPIVRRSADSFETAQGDPYSVRPVSPQEMVLEGNDRTLTFDRQSREFAEPVLANSGSDIIAFRQPGTVRQWFETVRTRFDADHGRSLKSCFSDRTCLAECPVSAEACDDLGDVIDHYLEQDQANDPLFVDLTAMHYFDQLLSQREQLLRFREELDNAEVRSLADARAATRSFFRWLAVDASTDEVVEIEDASGDDRNRTAEMIEVVGCTIVGYVPVVGDAVATGCALKSATGIATSSTSLAGSDLRGISLNRVMDGLIDAEERYHEIAYNKYDPLLKHALTDQQILAGIVKTIRDGRLAIPQALSEDEMKAAMWAAVWPYAFYGFGIGPAAATEIESGDQDNVCQVRPRTEDGEFAVSVHEHLGRGAARSGTRLANQHAVVRWSLHTGSIENGRPLKSAAVQSLARYLRDKQQGGFKIFTDFKADGRLFFESRYRIFDQWNWWPPIKYENLLSFPSAPALLPYDDKLRTIGVAQVGQSFAEDGSRRAIGRLECASMATF